MRVVVCGADDLEDQDYPLVFERLDFYLGKLDKGDLVILSRCGPGADKLGEDWATKRLVTYERWHPDEKNRDQEMLATAKAVIVFWGGGDEVKVLKMARQLKLKVKVVLC